MHIIIKNQNTLLYDEFKFKCSIGKKGISSNKKEGDLKTPRGTFSLGPLFYRKDKLAKTITKLKKIPLKKNMGWCNDPSSKLYNKLINTNIKVRHEKMFRHDSKYDLVISINYNIKKIIKNKGSAIFIHLTKNYKKTQGCIALKKKDLFILLKLINKKTKIKIL
tara:strand:+ start:1947 stop:2438 length:492 start_codon:yes stop_codon:yes gene_type:complete